MTLVELHLTSDAAEDVVLEPTHDGPVWPPRRQGVPEAGWEDDGWTGTVAPDDPVALGYATPATVEDPPVSVVEAEPADHETSADPTPRELVRTLGDARPPRDALPALDDPADEVSPTSDPAAGEGTTETAESTTEIAKPTGRPSASPPDAASDPAVASPPSFAAAAAVTALLPVVVLLALADDHIVAGLTSGYR